MHVSFVRFLAVQNAHRQSVFFSKTILSLVYTISTEIEVDMFIFYDVYGGLCCCRKSLIDISKMKKFLSRINFENHRKEKNTHLIDHFRNSTKNSDKKKQKKQRTETTNDGF